MFVTMSVSAGGARLARAMKRPPAPRLHGIEDERTVDLHPVARLQDMLRRAQATEHAHRRRGGHAGECFPETAGRKRLLQRRAAWQFDLTPPHAPFVRMDDFDPYRGHSPYTACARWVKESMKLVAIRLKMGPTTASSARLEKAYRMV